MNWKDYWNKNGAAILLILIHGQLDILPATSCFRKKTGRIKKKIGEICSSKLNLILNIEDFWEILATPKFYNFFLSQTNYY